MNRFFRKSWVSGTCEKARERVSRKRECGCCSRTVDGPPIFSITMAGKVSETLQKSKTTWAPVGLRYRVRYVPTPKRVHQLTYCA
jgi:hypothetical protein